MPAWSTETREFTEHRWLVRQPAHYTEVASAIDAAGYAWEQVSYTTGRSDITVRGEDDHVVVSFTVRTRPRVPGKRGTVLDVFEADGEDGA